MIEDSEHGILSAKSAGMKCIVLANPHMPDSKYSKVDFVVRNLRDIKLQTILSSV